MEKIIKRTEVFEHTCHQKKKRILTNENWFPAFNDGTVEVSLHVDRKYFQKTFTFGPPIDYRVAVWGIDDFGLEMSFSTFCDANDMFERIVNLTTQETLQAWGFGPA